MRLLRVVAAAGVLALAGLLAWHLTHQPKSVLKAVSQHRIVAAPNFRLRRLDGKCSLTLASLRGKPVVVNFWQSTCVPCKAEAPRLNAFAARWSNRITVVGIDVTEGLISMPRAFARHYHVSYPLLFDPNGSTAAPWGLIGTPETFFVDRRGRIVKRVLGPVSDSELDSQIEHALTT
jgi:cytochrome c biogenesis protein CcmG, thiol:disulfide interchange protein DsbE